MARRSLVDENDSDVKMILDLISTMSIGPDRIEKVLSKILKLYREQRYFERKLGYPQEWRRVLREGCSNYLISNYGFVRHCNRKTLLRPAFEHQYARAPLYNPDFRKNGGGQHMIHELVVESFILCAPIPDQLRDTKNMEVINHIDGDKYNPAISNLEITTQGENMLHAYSLGLRKPRN